MILTFLEFYRVFLYNWQVFPLGYSVVCKISRKKCKLLLKRVFLLVKNLYFIPQSGPCPDKWAFWWWLTWYRERDSVRFVRLFLFNSIWQLQNEKKLNQDRSLKLKLNPGLGLRQWSALNKNVRHRYDVGLRILWRENKFLSTWFWRFWRHFRQILLIFWF